ncbi:MAG: hypothetical protein MI867_19540 [Pseudomonadales bacterium]|nr:hypothetical protein [Pseudomonadales bacterium]
MEPSQNGGAPSKHIYIAMLIGMLLVAPSIITGLQLDDYYHWALVTQHALAVPGQDAAGIVGLFTFLDGDPQRTQALIEKGMLPWWTLPELKYAFWRPVAEITHIIDYGLWPNNPVLMHLHSLAYLLLLFIAVYRLFGRWLSGPALVWAFWIFALSYTHGFASGWLANRNAVLATLFVALTMLFHDRWRQSGKLSQHLLALMFFSLGLLSGEIGVSAGLFLLAFALCMEPSTNKASGIIGFIQRMLTIAPYGIVGILWLFARAILGYGAEGSGHYVDPTNVAAFLEIAGWRYFLLLTGLIWSLPPEFASLFGETLVIVVGVLGGGLLLWVLMPLFRVSGLARFFLLSCLLLLLPVCATNPHSRLLISAGIPMAALIGMYFGARRTAELSFSPVAKVLSLVLIVSLFVLAPLFTVVESVAMKLAMDGSLNHGAKNLQIEASEQPKTHIVLNPPLSSVAGYIQGVRAYHGLPTVDSVLPLASSSTDLSMERTDASAIRLHAPNGLYQAAQENLLRAQSLALKPGDKVQLSSLRAEVVAVNAEGVPETVDFFLTKPLESYVFHLWHKGKTAICELPPIGSRLTLTQDRDSCVL